MEIFMENRKPLITGICIFQKRVKRTYSYFVPYSMEFENMLFMVFMNFESCGFISLVVVCNVSRSPAPEDNLFVVFFYM